MVEYLEHGLSYHVAQELQCQDDASMTERLERAFLMADIHSRQLGVTMSGATVAICLVKVCFPYNILGGIKNSFDSSTVSCFHSYQRDKTEKNVTLYAANAGDARIVLGHDGKATRLTKDHRTDDAEEVERIEKAGGFMFKGRVLGVLAVTRSLGDHCMKAYVIAEPYCQEKSIELTNHCPSFVILACDGLWDVIQDQQAVDFVLKYQEDKENISQHLINEALRRGSTDNITVVVAWL